MQNIEMTEFKKQIHCKLTFNDQIRRFIFNGTEFAELRGHISHLLSLPPDGFVLKYVDNESDLITLSSTEDLILALDLSDKLLRLVVENSSVSPISTSSSTHSTPLSSPPAAPLVDPGMTHSGLNHGFGRGHHGHGHHPHPWHHGGGMHGGGHHGRGHHGGWHHGGHGDGMHGGGCHNFDGDKKEKARVRIQSKIDFLKKSLEEIATTDDWKRQGILMKINRLEHRLLRWDAIADKKMCKRKQKEDKKWDKKLSPEALTQVQTLKSQIATLKPVLYQLKVTKKAKKSELELALQTGQGDKENIWSEILRLKESIHETQKQISSLKDQIHAIRG
jgi:predicted DNA-binding protein YlxM (UPF0122 family)